MLTRASREEKGAVAIMVALSMILLMGMAALTLDGGIAFNERRATQNSADHAALAAAWAACTASGDPVAAGTQVATNNGYTASADIDVQIIPEGGNAYRAIISSTSETEFAPVIGSEEVTVLSEALADCTALAGLGDLSIFGGAPTSCGNVVDLSGSSKNVEGGVHSNGNMKSTGASGNYNGPVTVVGGVNPDPAGNNNYAGGLAEGSDSRDYPVPDYWLDVNYWLTNHDYMLTPGNVDTSDFPGPGVYYANGDVKLMGVDLTEVTIIATGEIDAVGPTNRLTAHPGVDGLVLLSYAQDGYYEKGVTEGPCNDQAIHLSASNNQWAGAIFAPNGQIQLSNSAAGTFDLSGTLIGYTVKSSGSNLDITKNPDVAGETEYTVELTE